MPSAITISASRQLALATAAFAILITTVVTLFQMNKELDSVNLFVESEIRKLQESTVPVMSQTVWELNLDGVRTIAESLAKVQSVNYVAVQQARKLVVESGTRREDSIRKVFDLTISEDGISPKKVGEMEVQFDIRAEKTKLEQKYVSLTVANLILILAQSGFMLLLLEYRFMRHIRKLTEYVGNLGYETLSEKLSFKRMNLGVLNNDEIAVLSAGVENMRSKWEGELHEREASNKELGFKSKVMADGFGATAEISQFIASSLENLDLVLQHVVDRAVVLTDASASAICFLEDGVLSLVNYTKTNPQADKLFVESFPRKTSDFPIYNHLLEGKLLVIENIDTDEKVTGDIKSISHSRGYKSLLLIPLKVENAVIGVLSVASSSNSKYKPDQIKLLEVMGDQAAIAIKISRLFVEAQRAKRVAEEAGEAKANFLANMSHEIRTPMNSILGFATLIGRTQLSEKQIDYINKIKYSGQHLLGIINDILDISKMEAGRLNIENIEFDLNTVLHNIGGLLSDNSAKKNLNFSLDVDPRIPTALIGDPLRIGQVLINLTNNAIKFTETGAVSIDISIDPDADPAAPRESADLSHENPTEKGASVIQVKFKIRDTGIGLTEEQMSRLFGRFVQADSSTTRQYGGTGLGLAICKNLVELMHGSVGVESKQGEGSCFWFSLPLGVIEGSSVNDGFVPNEYRVLVVDDNLQTLDLTREMLTQIGTEVSSVDSGPKALLALDAADRADRPFDLVLLDWQMPTMNGVETAQRIAKIGLQKAPVLVLITGHARAEIYDQSVNDLFVDILIKPVSSFALRELIGRLARAPDTRQKNMDTDMGVDETDQQHSAEQLSKIELLVVEDNKFNQQIANELLTEAGYSVSLADNGKIAIDMIEARVANGSCYDLVLMDMQMPVMDGIEATKLLRKKYTNAQLPVLAMTANAMQIDRDRCLAAGMDDFLTKPIEPQRLFEIIERWIKVRPAPVAPASMSTKAAESESLALRLAGIPHLDVQSGLSLMRGNEKLYLDSLRAFSSKVPAFSREIIKSIDDQNYGVAERLLHTMKGQTAYLGARQLNAASDRIESMLRGGEFKANELALEVESLLSALNAFEASVNTSIASDSKHIEQKLQPSTTPKDPIASKKAYAKFLEAVMANDPGSQELLEVHRDELQGIIGASFESVAELLASFQFDEAISLLKKL